jgi:hypothetical protein
MDLTTFFAQAKQNVVVPVQKIQEVQDVAIHTQPASRKAPPKRTKPPPTLPATKKQKNVKSSPKHVKSPKLKVNSPTSPKHSPQLDTIDPDLEDPLDAEADVDVDADFDEVENDSEWGGDEAHDADSQCGSQFGDDNPVGDDIDDEPVTYDMDLEPSYAKLGAWKRRDKSTLPKPEFVGPPLTPDDDDHIF